jgi:hypothetical protein
MATIVGILNRINRHPVIAIFGFTAAIYYFSVASVENKVLLAKSEMETYRAETAVYKAKVDVLEKEIDATRAENKQYKEWFMSSDEVTPVFYEKLTSLQKENSEAKEIIASLRKAGQDIDNKYHLKTKTFEVSRGSSVTDEMYGVVIGVHEIGATRRASLSISYQTPGVSTVEDNIAPGTVKYFKVGEVKCKLVIDEINYVADKVQVTLSPVK